MSAYSVSMDKLLQHRQSALKNVQMAAYLLSTTYPLLKEPKTLLMISNHVFSSFMSSVSAILFFERSKRTIPPYHETNESKINCFKQHLVKKHSLQEYLETIEKILNISKEHKNAAIEFSRDKKYVICADQFSKIETVSEEDVKHYVKKAKEFITKVGEIVSHE